MLDQDWETLAELARSAGRPASMQGPEALAGPVGRLHALHRIMQAATRSLNLDEMLTTVVRVLRQTVDVDVCSIFLYDQATGTLTLRATDGINPHPPGSVTLPLGVGITGQAAVTQQVLVAADAPNHPAYLDYPHVNNRPFASQVSVPLTARAPGGLLGVLNLMSLERREFTPEELSFLETAAGEISIALENAQLYRQTDEELRRRIAQLELLQQLWRAIASTLDLQQLLELISTKAIALANAQAVVIYRRPRSRPAELELLAQSPEVAGVGAPLDEALRAVVARVLDEGRAIWQRLEGSGAAVYSLPMITGRRAVGAVCLLFPLDAEEPSQPQLLHAFTDTAAIAIENAELYDEARRGLSRASALLRELHHRVRNNLQTVAALLSLQARRAAPEVREPLQEAVSRIRSLTIVHDLLSGHDLEGTSIEALARTVTTEVVHTLCGDEPRIQWSVSGDEVVVSARQATILALLLNEFVTNAIRHGFNEGEKGTVAVRCRREGNWAVLEVEDTGHGLPPSFDLRTSRGLGLQIARTLTEVDLRGQLAIMSSDAGTTVRIRFIPDAPVPAGEGASAEPARA